MDTRGLSLAVEVTTYSKGATHRKKYGTTHASIKAQHLVLYDNSGSASGISGISR